MPRTYEQRLRADATERTRRRILDVTRRLVAGRADLPMQEIARRARVSVQTLYTHFGSKRNLLMAVIDEVQRDAGLYGGITEVWAARDGETALRRMVGATLRLWDGAWPFIEFSLRLRRTDPELGTELAGLDAMRVSHLLVICRRLADEGRLAPDLTAERAAELAFALSAPAVYEELVQRRGWSLEAATDGVTEAVTGLLTPGTGAAPDAAEPIDWQVYGLEAPEVTFLEAEHARSSRKSGPRRSLGER